MNCASNIIIIIMNIYANISYYALLYLKLGQLEGVTGSWNFPH